MALTKPIYAPPASYQSPKSKIPYCAHPPSPGWYHLKCTSLPSHKDYTLDWSYTSTTQEPHLLKHPSPLTPNHRHTTPPPKMQLTNAQYHTQTHTPLSPRRYKSSKETSLAHTTRNQNSSTSCTNTPSTLHSSNNPRLPLQLQPPKPSHSTPLQVRPPPPSRGERLID